MTIELQGIVLHGFHGVLEHERRDGQRFLVDVELDLEHEQASRTDRIEDAVDYREVVARVRAISDARAYQLLEAFTAAIADALVAEYPVTAVRVRVRKPDVVLDPPVEFAAVAVERRGSRAGRGARLRRARCESGRPGGDADARGRAPGRAARRSRSSRCRRCGRRMPSATSTSPGS